MHTMQACTLMQSPLRATRTPGLPPAWAPAALAGLLAMACAGLRGLRQLRVGHLGCLGPRVRLQARPLGLLRRAQHGLPLAPRPLLELVLGCAAQRCWHSCGMLCTVFAALSGRLQGGAPCSCAPCCHMDDVCTQRCRLSMACPCAPCRPVKLSLGCTAHACLHSPTGST